MSSDGLLTQEQIEFLLKHCQQLSKIGGSKTNRALIEARRGHMIDLVGSERADLIDTIKGIGSKTAKKISDCFVEVGLKMGDDLTLPQKRQVLDYYTSEGIDYLREESLVYLKS